MRIYESRTLRAFMTRGAPDSDLADLVTFEPLNSRRELFAATVAQKYGFNVVHIVPGGNDWYQYDDLDLCLDSVAAVTAPGATITGASMGGYAATTYSDRLPATKTLTYGPQFSIQRTVVPEETRWATESERIEFRSDDAEIGQRARHYVLYDPLFSRDVRHVELIATHGRDVVLVPVSCGGHTIARTLAQAGVLSAVLRTVLAGEPTRDELSTLIDEQLPGSSHYQLGVALQQPLAMREPYLRTALELTPKDVAVLKMLGNTLCELGDVEGLDYLRAALKRRPNDPRFLRALERGIKALQDARRTA
ncbi:hypothetical protein GI374_04660 [Paracoccus sp. S-4012]|uniref:hypothetical protein n=1 Tax=Paracoccus sp. S-4012 TaxID=2665648 RepID=UPI0012B069C1|nr:hypothetical protein [Paracoccus sp. S-4012]MRX49752.1 hypothetical protein [Paracoccus sp. S-4012]